MTEWQSNDPWHETPAEAGGAHASLVLPVRAMFISVGCFVLLAAAWEVGLWFVVKLEAGPRAVDRDTSAVSGYERQAERERAGGPALQPSVSHDTLPRADLEAVRGVEDGVFAKMGWAVDGVRHQATVPAGVVEEVAREEGAKAAAPTGRAGGTMDEANVVTPVPGVDQGGGE